MVITVNNEFRRIKIYDTTLRDGEQTPGVKLGPSQKTAIAKQLIRLGVDQIEAGFPAASQGDFEAVSAIARLASDNSNVSVSALARLSRRDIDRAWEAVSSAASPMLHVFIASSDIHLEHKLHMSRREALERVEEYVKYAASLCDNVRFSPEDATRSDYAFLRETVELAVKSGAKVINIPDTVGYSFPGEYSELISRLREDIPALQSVSLSTHCHNDLGLAVANSIGGVLAGADTVECTVNGIGERAGNASLEEIVMALNVRGDISRCKTALDTRELTRTSRLVSQLTDIPVPPNKAIVGGNAFSHESGIHQHGMLCDSRTYQIISPETVGLETNLMPLGKLSGRHAFAERILKLGYSLDEHGIDATFARFKEIADIKIGMTDDDICALVNEYLDSRTGKYYLRHYQIQSGNHLLGMALVTLTAGGNDYTEAAPGNGPVDAVFCAVNRIASANGDITGELSLENYELRAVTEGADALGEVKVTIKESTSGSEFTGRGVSTDIIKASLKAYLNAVNKLVSLKS